MLQTDKLDSKSILVYSGAASARSMFTSICTHPLEVIKTRQQDSQQSRRVSEIAKTIFQEKGFRGFYSGLTPKITSLLVKDWWRWPVIICLPGYLEKNYSLSPMQSQIFSGVFVSTIDTATTAPLEKYRIQSITGTLPPKGQTFYQKIQRALHGGWNGFPQYWCRSTAGWVSFSTSQRFIRDEYKNITHKTDLNTMDLVVIGVGVGVVTSLTLAPFDFANTRGQSRDISLMELWRTSKKMSKKAFIRQLWRGAFVQVLISSIQNIASVALIDKLSPEFD